MFLNVTISLLTVPVCLFLQVRLQPKWFLSGEIEE